MDFNITLHRGHSGEKCQWKAKHQRAFFSAFLLALLSFLDTFRLNAQSVFSLCVRLFGFSLCHQITCILNFNKNLHYSISDQTNSENDGFATSQDVSFIETKRSKRQVRRPQNLNDYAGVPRLKPKAKNGKSSSFPCSYSYRNWDCSF